MQRPAGDAGEGGGRRALAAGVADDEPRAAGEGDHVEEVASDPVPLGHVVAGRQLETVHLRQRRRDQALLQFGRHRLGLAAQLRLEVQRPAGGESELQLVHHHGGEILQRRHLLAGSLPRLAVDHAQRAEVVPVVGP